MEGLVIVRQPAFVVADALGRRPWLECSPIGTRASTPCLRSIRIGNIFHPKCGHSSIFWRSVLAGSLIGRDVPFSPAPSRFSVL